MKEDAGEKPIKVYFKPGPWCAGDWSTSPVFGHEWGPEASNHNPREKRHLCPVWRNPPCLLGKGGFSLLQLERTALHPPPPGLTPTHTAPSGVEEGYSAGPGWSGVDATP